MKDQITKLHQTYCDLLGMELPLLAHHERLWFDAIKDGLTEEVLRAVILSRKSDVKSGKRYRNAILLRNLIGDPGIVADLLNEAAMLAAQKRAFAPNPAREAVLRATGRTSVPSPHLAKSLARSIGEVLGSLKERS